MWRAHQEGQEGGEIFLKGDISWAATRNTNLVQEVQQEMARLRTLQSSPLLSRVHSLRDEYLDM
ncbi:hypothetical protein Hamer_G023325 [Homarus americanus]|uniref:Uncharacterized protein n=2 Tax=Homarus americanus TaxID=6706 RepID=A0A8J5MSB0_HOMAM|nr:hypothetical protein Hamer_G023325 [Homarus americanus]